MANGPCSSARNLRYRGASLATGTALITTVSQLLTGLQEAEAEKLRTLGIKHAPTIGALYEGLSRDIIGRAIPPEWDVRVVEGFIKGRDGELGPQSDVLVVTGEGEQLPRLDSFVWPVKDVLAIVEVKKNLYSKDLEEGFESLLKNRQVFQRWIEHAVTETFDLAPTYKAFAYLTGRLPGGFEQADALPQELSYPFHVLSAEQAGPVRILLGFEGFAKEANLRKAYVDFLFGKLRQPGYGPVSLPSLVVCRSNAILKLNGQPYIAPTSKDGWWTLLASSSENPLRPMIELLWTKMVNRFDVSVPMDDTLSMESLRPLLKVRLHHSGQGWEFNEVGTTRPVRPSKRNPKAKGRKEVPAMPAKGTLRRWSPHKPSEMEMVALLALQRGGVCDLNDLKFRDMAAGHGTTPEAVLDTLVGCRLAAWVDDHRVRAISPETLALGITRAGEAVAADNVSLLSMWIKETDPGPAS